MGGGQLVVPRGAGAGHLRRRHGDAGRHHRARARLHRPGPGADRRAADRRAAEAGDHAQRRAADGRGRPGRLRLRGRPRGPGDLHPLPQDPQRRRLRRLHPRDARGPPGGHHHRPARRLRPRPHHRRLPPGGPLRRRPARRGQARRAGRAGRVPSTDDVIRDREELAEQIRALGELAEMARSYGYDISRPATQRPGGHPVAVLRLPRRGQGAERRGDVAGPHLDLPRRLPAARPRRGDPRRVRRPGTDRRLRHQAADHPVPAHPRVRRAVLRRPDLGHRGDRRHRRRTAGRW